MKLHRPAAVSQIFTPVVLLTHSFAFSGRLTRIFPCIFPWKCCDLSVKTLSLMQIFFKGIAPTLQVCNPVNILLQTRSKV